MVNAKVENAVIIIGFILVILGLTSFSYGSQSSYGIGAFFLVLGFLIVVFGALSKREQHVDHPNLPLAPPIQNAPPTAPSQNIVDGERTIIKETIREIVKVPCQYCGSLNENTCKQCESCGAPLR